MLTLVATLVALSVLILVHELGHFFAAKSVDIATPRFSLGLGPRVAGFKWGETDFVISAIPLGGYVKMAGMEDDEGMEVLEGGGEPPADPSRTFDAKPIWARTWVISAGVTMNLLFALLANIVLAAGQGRAGLRAVSGGFTATADMTLLLLVTLRDLLTGALPATNLGGLLAIGEAAGVSAAHGPTAYLWFLAFLSVNLAVLNLLPIPILDGGHLMFLAIEAVRGRPLPLETRIRLSHLGLIMVVGLMVWANGNDVVRLAARLF